MSVNAVPYAGFLLASWLGEKDDVGVLTLFTLRYVKEGKKRLLKVHVPSRKFIRGNLIFRWIVVEVAVVCRPFQLEKKTGSSFMSFMIIC